MDGNNSKTSENVLLRSWEELPVPKRNYCFLSGITSNYVMEWRWLVTQYSNLALTFEKDKLPVLSGLAKQFA
jgi:hypothetical protein